MTPKDHGGKTSLGASLTFDSLGSNGIGVLFGTSTFQAKQPKGHLCLAVVSTEPPKVVEFWQRRLSFAATWKPTALFLVATFSMIPKTKRASA